MLIVSIVNIRSKLLEEFVFVIFVIDFIKKLVSGPEIRIIATPEAPIPVDKAQIVMNILYIEFFIRISLLYYDYLVSVISKKWKYLGTLVSKKLFLKTG